MTVHLYLSLIPEALIASMLPPEEFAMYYTVGYSKKMRGQAMFIELDPAFRHEFFSIEQGLARCVPHEDGSPKKSVYIATYRVLEHIPLTDINTLYLVTRFGEALALKRSENFPTKEEGLYMYQEIAPKFPLVVSSLPPLGMYKLLTQDESSLIHLPAVCFVELRLGELANNPEFGKVKDLPYTGIHHLRECLIELENKRVHTKIVDRVHTVEYPYRMIDSGIYMGNTDELAYFPLPDRDRLRNEYYRWWRSANS
ncbi:MAG: hypothetical protein R3293_23100 [Candidatus Promineifilaceae bacterium]|nr:hypothetical protein [Candidatus Promineifilaceae bacterium]